MTIELLEKRKQDLINQLNTLQGQITQANAQLNALGGAIQDCDYWLNQLKAAAVSPEPPTPA